MNLTIVHECSIRQSTCYKIVVITLMHKTHRAVFVME